MEFEIGKRYCWSPYHLGKEKWKNGILSKIFETHGIRYGIFVTRENEEWQIPLWIEDLEEFKNKKGE